MQINELQVQQTEQDITIRTNIQLLHAHAHLSRYIHEKQKER